MSSPARIRRRLGQRGFTFVEVMVVVAIISLLAAVATVSLLRARVTTGDHMAAANLQTLSKAIGFFQLVYQRYPADLTELGPPNANPPFIDPVLIGDGTTANKQGAVFVYAVPAPETFTITVNPQAVGVTGNRHYYTEALGEIHYTDQNRDANAADPVLGN